MLGSIYIIKNQINNLFYIGSTCRTVEIRMNEHIHDQHVYLNLRLYKAMLEYGHENFYIELLEAFTYDDIKELRAREGFYVRAMSPELNKNIPGRSPKEYKADNKIKIEEYRKKYVENNKIKIDKYQEKYQVENKVKLNEYRKLYYRKYRLDNKDKMRKYYKEYQLKKGK